MKFYRVEPEVAGGFGEKTELDHTVHPPHVTVLEYQFNGWLRDGLLEVFPCFIVQFDIADRLRRSMLTGFELDNVQVSISQFFEDLHGDFIFPAFEWSNADRHAGLRRCGDLAQRHVDFVGGCCCDQRALKCCARFNIGFRRNLERM